ncbi:MAG: PLD nuclease N-terminal domain-containing protein [Candidatus Planktophila sp.]
MAKYIGIISIALTLFAFVDCAMREDVQIKKLPKWGWLLVIILFPPFGSVVYLVAGRTGVLQRRPKKNKPRIIPPDDNPDFLRGL